MYVQYCSLLNNGSLKKIFKTRQILLQPGNQKKLFQSVTELHKFCSSLWFLFN